MDMCAATRDIHPCFGGSIDAFGSRMCSPHERCGLLITSERTERQQLHEQQQARQEQHPFSPERKYSQQQQPQLPAQLPAQPSQPYSPQPLSPLPQRHPHHHPHPLQFSPQQPHPPLKVPLNPPSRDGSEILTPPSPSSLRRFGRQHSLSALAPVVQRKTLSPQIPSTQSSPGHRRARSLARPYEAPPTPPLSVCSPVPDESSEFEARPGLSASVEGLQGVLSCLAHKQRAVLEAEQVLAEARRDLALYKAKVESALESMQCTSPGHALPGQPVLLCRRRVPCVGVHSLRLVARRSKEPRQVCLPPVLRAVSLMLDVVQFFIAVLPTLQSQAHLHPPTRTEWIARYPSVCETLYGVVYED